MKASLPFDPLIRKFRYGVEKVFKPEKPVETIQKKDDDDEGKVEYSI